MHVNNKILEFFDFEESFFFSSFKIENINNYII